jgi:hypothetical protein
MKKIFTIALICATIGFFSTGCVDVAGPGGTTPANPNNPSNPTDPNNPTDPSNPNNPTDPTNPSTPSVPTDPTDPMYPGETGVNYTTNWAAKNQDGGNYDTTISPQRYVGANYDDSNEANVAATIADKETAPYKTTFSDGTICYSVVKFPHVTYSTDSTVTDCYYEGTAIDGFVLTDYEYKDGEIKFKGEGTETVASGTTDGNYRTVFGTGGDTETRVTKRPFLRVTYYKNSDGSHYVGSSDYVADDDNYSYYYVTEWSGGEYTLSTNKFADATYRLDRTSTYSTDNTIQYHWAIGTAPDGHKESDYTLIDGEYKYNDASATPATPTTPAATTTPSTPIDDVIEDIDVDVVEDVVGDILDNDGISLRR